jgi:tetratricopeptide (TPR) repeat protein
MAKYLEEIYAELAEKFQYRPKGPILIELFNNHTMFSGRVIALPDLYTIGACTGQVVALVSPRDKAKRIPGPFNWVRVLRHELVHVFNLEQTRFKVPHWFTEGLAVSLEGFPVAPQWHQLLKERVASGELFDLDNVLMGFVRPNNAEERQLAYLQSLLYVEYLTATYGKDKIGGFLKAYADGLDTDAAIAQLCKTSKAAFEKGYRAFLVERVKKVTGRPAQKEPTFKELEAAHAANPDNPDTCALLAERWFQLGDVKTARKLAEHALAKRKNHPLASYVQARVLLEEKKAEQALTVLKAAVSETAPEIKVLRLLGQLQVETKNFVGAAATYELARKVEPYESIWLTQLARAYRQTGDNEKLIAVLKELAPLSPDDLDLRRHLAEMLSKKGDHAGAERYARQALEIDVLDEPSQRILETALQGQGKAEELKQLQKLLQR